jgi:hypothetical protein
MGNHPRTGRLLRLSGVSGSENSVAPLGKPFVSPRGATGDFAVKIANRTLATLLGLAGLATVAACDSKKQDAVENAYDNQAAIVDNQAQNVEDLADNLTGNAADAAEHAADALENKADKIRDAGDKAKDAVGNHM